LYFKQVSLFAHPFQYSTLIFDSTTPWAKHQLLEFRGVSINTISQASKLLYELIRIFKQILQVA
jgi:hypothetical protein